MARLLIFGAVLFACLFVVLADEPINRRSKSDSKYAGPIGRRKARTVPTATTTPKPTKAPRFAPGSNKQCINTCLNTCGTAQMALGCGFCRIPGSKCYDANSICTATTSPGTCQCRGGFKRVSSSCVPCPANSISTNNGADCSPCGAGTTPNNSRTACVSTG